MDAERFAEATSTETLNFGVPEPIASAIRRAARNELISKSAYARRAVMAALQRDGFLDNPPSAGARV
jgi:hypothetical protein